MSNVERGISITPDKQNKKEVLILDFLAVAQQGGVLNQLDERRHNLIDAYFKTGATLESLKGVAGVGTRERVRQLIVSGIERLWKTLPPSLQENYPQEEIIAMLHFETRARMSEARKTWWASRKQSQDSPAF